MALARVKTWIAGEVLNALDLNNEFNNFLNNPISLISPTTGVITFSTNQTFPVAQLSSAPVASSFLTSGTVAAGSILYFSTAATPLLDTRAIGTAGRLLIVSTASLPAYSTGMLFDSTAKTLFVQRLGFIGLGTALTSNNFSLSTGWGSTATISAIRGTDEAFSLTITAAAGVAANPTVTTTFADGAWPSAPVGVIGFTGGSGAGGAFGININPSSTGLNTQMFMTPTDGLTYTFSVICMG